MILNTSTKMKKAQKLYESRNFKEYKREITSNLEIIFYECNL